LDRHTTCIKITMGKFRNSALLALRQNKILCKDRLDFQELILSFIENQICRQRTWYLECYKFCSKCLQKLLATPNSEQSLGGCPVIHLTYCRLWRRSSGKWTVRLIVISILMSPIEMLNLPLPRLVVCASEINVHIR